MGPMVASMTATGPARLDRDSALPLWAQLLEDLRKRLDSLEFADTFPSELELTQQYGVSRNTVRDAVRRLRSEGVVVAGPGRKPRRGADVAIDQPVGALYSLFRSVEATGLEQRSVVRSLAIETHPGAADKLAVDRTAELFHLERVRLADENPLAIDDVWIPADIGRALLSVDFTHTAFYDELASRTGERLTGGEERIHAVVPSADQRHLLQIPRGVAALAIDRLGLVGERRVEWRQTVVRGDRFSITATFSAGLGYRVDLGHAQASQPDASW